MIYAVIPAAAVVAGVIQSVTGFGAGIFMMLFFPMFLPVINASALSSAISVLLSGTMYWRYRKYVQFKAIIPPACFYLVVSSLSIYLAPYAPKAIMLKCFGVFLIILSIYFLFFPNKIKIRASLPTACVCASLSGLASGLFGIGGPPMVIYFLAATDTKEDYLGTIQFFFTLTGLYNTIFRVFCGIYTVDLIPLTLIGIVGIMGGKQIGQRIIDRINGEMMKKVIYVFLAISGVLNLVK